MMLPWLLKLKTNSKILLLSSFNSEPVIDHFLEQADTYHYIEAKNYVHLSLSQSLYTINRLSMRCVVMLSLKLSLYDLHRWLLPLNGWNWRASTQPCFQSEFFGGN